MDNILPTFNLAAILVSGAAYWLLGSLWFSLIAGNTWSTELEKHGVIIKEPGKGEIAKKMIITFILNVLVAFGIAIILWISGTGSVREGIMVGLIIGICFSAATVGIAYTWESRSLKLFLIDAAYPVLGIIICAVILSWWK